VGIGGLSSLILTPLLLHHLGVRGFAIWTLATTTVGYLELLELGFGGTPVKLVSEDATVRPERALATLNTTFFVLVPLGALALVAGLGIAAAFPAMVHAPSHLHTETVVVVAILAVGLAISIPGDSFSGALIAHQRFDMVAGSNSAMAVCTGASIIGVLLSGGGIVEVAVVSTVVATAFHLVRFLLLRRVLPGARITPRLIDRSRRHVARQMSWWFMLIALLAFAVDACDVVLVGILLGLGPAAVYAVAAKLSSAALAGLDSLAGAFFPHASATMANEEPSRLRILMLDGQKATLVLGFLIGAVLVILGGPGVAAWVGHGYDQSARILVVLALAMTGASLSRTTSNILAGMGRLRVLTLIRVSELVSNVVLSVILGLAIGPVGVAFGTLGGVVLVRIPTSVVLANRMFGIRAGELFRSTVVPHFLPLSVSSAVMVALRPAATRSDVMLVVAALAGVVAYGAVYFLTGTSPQQRQRVLERVPLLRQQGAQ